MAIFGRQLGFTLFYGSVILKIYRFLNYKSKCILFRNLQEYRVRKAQHVIVRELDLIFYLLFALFVVIYGLLYMTTSSHSFWLFRYFGVVLRVMGPSGTLVLGLAAMPGRGVHAALFPV